jgi:hypothetical protein
MLRLVGCIELRNLGVLAESLGHSKALRHGARYPDYYRLLIYMLLVSSLQEFYNGWTMQR